MKKLLILISSAILLVNLMACENKKPTDSISNTLTDTTSSSSTSINKEYKKLFNNVTVPEDIKVGETSIFTLNEIEVGTIKDNYNPYSSKEISVDLYIKDPDGKEYFRPAYWTQDFKSTLNTLIPGNDWIIFDDEIKGTESLVREGDEHFSMSFKPLTKGIHNVKAEVFIGNVLKETFSFDFECKEENPDYKGKIVINDTNKRYFMYENTKETYIPVGMNNCWYTANSRKSYDFDEWFKRMKDSECNFSRLWMASWGYGLHIGTGAKVDDFSMRLNQASRLERTLQVAEEDGIYLYLCMLNHGQFSTKVNAEWDKNAYNSILTKPYEFFTNSKAKALYKDELRYIVARYGTYDSLLAYELFNEVDWTDYAAMYGDKIKSWHKEMAEYISSIDCYDRLITTSYKGTLGQSFTLNEMDISNIHNYSFGSKDAIDYTINEINANYNSYKKIVLFAEWGVNANSGSDTYDVDPKGVSLYQSMWASLMAGGAGTTMNWWWNDYIHRYNLYSLYVGIGKYSKMMNLNGNVSYFNKIETIPSGLKILGLNVDNRTYAYIYDSKYSRFNDSLNEFSGSITLNKESGNYTVKLIDPRTGEIVNQYSANSDGKISVDLGTFNCDIAIIIE